MIYPYLFLLLVALISLIYLGYRRPQSLRSAYFPFIRKCLGWSMGSYGGAVILFQCVPFERDFMGWAVFAQIVSWIAIIFVFRGLFELLAAHRVSGDQERDDGGERGSPF